MKYIIAIFLITWVTKDCIQKEPEQPCKQEWVKKRRVFSKWEGAEKFLKKLKSDRKNKDIEVEMYP